MDPLSQLLSTLKVQANIFHNGQYCGNWALDTSGSNHISFHVVTHGDCYLKVDDTDSIKLETGDMVVFPHDSRHCISGAPYSNQQLNEEASEGLDVLKDDGTGLVCGYFEHQNPLIKNITKPLPSYIVVRYCSENPSVINGVQSLMIQESLYSHDSSKANHSGHTAELVLNKLAECLLALLFRDELPVETGVLAAMGHPRLSLAIDAVHESPDKKWTLEELASLCSMSRAAFSKLFKDVVGQTPMEYLLYWRIALAYRLLADEKVSTLEAALKCGYENESSFSKVFKRIVGMGPGAIRSPL
jgi:AraC-like DNA-binding protein